MNSPESSYALIALDIDGKHAHETHNVTCDIYHECFVVDWDYGGHVYIEKSRNRRGNYIWMIVQRASDPHDFNLLCNALSMAMRTKYINDGVNKFDAIKGTCHFDSRDDLSKLFAECDGDLNDDHRGVLVTMPMAGVLNRPDPERELAAFMAFVDRNSKKHYVNAIPEMHLRGLLQRFDPARAAELEEQIAKHHAAKHLPQATRAAAVASSIGNPFRLSPHRKTTRTLRNAKARTRLIAKAHGEISGKNRMAFVSSLFFYEHRRYAETPEELLAYYKANRFAKTADDRKDIVRLKRADEVLAQHKANPAKPATSFDLTLWLPIVDEFVTQDVRMRSAIKYRFRIEDELLAAGLCLFTLNAFAKHRADRMFTCGQEAQRIW